MNKLFGQRIGLAALAAAVWLMPLAVVAQPSHVRLTPVGNWPVTGEVRGLALDAQVVGGLAYEGNDQGLVIFEVATRRQIGFCPVGSVAAVQVVGSYAWVAVNGLVENEVAGSGVAVVDISDPTQPIVLNSIWISLDRVTSLQVLDEVVYVSSAGFGLDMVNLGNSPAGLTLSYAGGYYTGGGANRIQVVRWGGGPLVTNLAFLADGSSGLQLLDATVPTNVVSINRYSTSGPAMDVQLQTNRLYGTNLVYAAVAEGLYGLEGVNVTTLDRLNQLWPYINSTNPASFAGAVQLTTNHLAYVAASAAGVQVFDVSNPTNINQNAWTNTLVAEYPSGFALKLQVVGTNTYVAAREAGLQVLDITFPTRAVYLASFGASGYSLNVTVSSNLAYLADGYGGLRVLDVSRPSLPRSVGQYLTNGYQTYLNILPNVTKACAVSNYIYVLDYNFGLIILTNPPTSAVAWTNALGVAGVFRGMDLQVIGDRAFVVDDQGTITVVNVQDRTSPSVSCSYVVNGPTRSLKVVNNMAYVCNGAGLQMLDVTKCPIRWRGEFPVDGMAVAVDVVSNLAYVADAFLGLKVVDVTTPSSPVLKGCFVTRGSAAAVTVASNWVYVSSLDGGLDVLQADRLTALDTNCLRTNAVCDCAQTNEVRMGGINWGANSAQVVGDLIFLATGSYGMGIVSQAYGDPNASDLHFQDLSNGVVQVTLVGNGTVVWTNGAVMSVWTNCSCIDSNCVGLMDTNLIVANLVCFGNLCTNLPGLVYWTNLWTTISNGLQFHDSCLVGICTNSVVTNFACVNNLWTTNVATNLVCTNLACVRWLTTYSAYVSNLLTTVKTTNLWCGPIATNYTFSVGLETGSLDRHTYILDRMDKLRTNWMSVTTNWVSSSATNCACASVLTTNFVSVATNVTSDSFTVLQDPAATNRQSFYRVRVAP